MKTIIFIIAIVGVLALAHSPAPAENAAVEHILPDDETSCGDKGQGASDYLAGVDYFLAHPDELKNVENQALQDCVKIIPARVNTK